MQRLGYLDGLRGLLAIIVFSEHFTKAFFPTLFTHETIWYQGTGMDLALVFSPLTYLYNGAFAVAGFFVLSGYLLTRSVWFVTGQSTSFHLIQLLRRYLRFSVPIASSLIFVVITGRIGLLNYSDFITEHGSNLKEIYVTSEPFTIGAAISQGFFSSLLAFDYSHNPVLWVMTPEMLAVATVCIFGFLLNVFPLSQKFRIWMLITFLTLTFILVHGYLFVGLWIGAFLFSLEVMLRKSLQKEKLVKVTLFVIGLFIALMEQKGGASNPFIIGPGQDHVTTLAYTIYGIAWGFMLLAILNLKPLQRILSANALQSLGKSSFGIYLFHYPLLGAIAIPLSTQLTGWWAFDVVLAGTVTFFVAYLIGIASYNYVERPIMGAKEIRLGIKYCDRYRNSTTPTRG